MRVHSSCGPLSVASGALVFTLLSLSWIAGCGSGGAGSATCQGDGCAAVTPDGASPDGGAIGVDGPASVIPLVCPMAKIELPASPAPADGDAFGASVAIDGNVVVIGAPGTERSSGAVHLFSREACAVTHRGAPTPPSNPGDTFGERVALAGSTLVVAAPGTETFQSVGTTVTTLYGVGEVFTAVVPPSGVPAGFVSLGTGYREFDRHGQSLAISPDAKTLMIGLPGYEYTQLTPTEVGSAHVLTRATAADKFVLAGGDLYTGEDAAESGAAVALVTDGIALAGAPGSGGGAGKVNVFTREGDQWKRTAELLPKTPAPQSRFGSTLVFFEGFVVVGAPDFDEAGAAGAGAAFVFVRGGDGTFSEVQRLAPATRAKDDHFGASIAISKDVIIIGAPNQHGGDRAGTVYVFQKTGDTWTEKSTLNAPTSAAGDLFGAAVAVSSGFAVIGAPGASAGAAFALTL